MKFLPLLPLLALFATTAAHAERLFIDEPEPIAPRSIGEREPWKEGAAKLPPWPDDGDLVEFELDGAPSPMRFYIDGKNLNVGTDGVVRYTLVIESRSGTRNLSFEGIRCTLKGAYKVYAYGEDGKFNRTPEGDWLPISGGGHDRYHQELHRHHLCVPLKLEPRPKKDMLRALKGRIDPRANTGFLSD